MKRIALMLAVVAWSLPGTFLHGQETAEMQLEFIRKLRVRGYADLALEYLSQLEKSTDPAIVAVLPLERARLALSLSRGLEGGQRLDTLKKARAELAIFVQKNPGRPETTQAMLDIARLAIMQGKETLTQALRHEEPKMQQEHASQAEPLFQEALQQFEAASKQLGETERVQARLERAITMLQQADIYVNLSDDIINTKRAKLLSEAIKALEGVVSEEKGNASLLASAWLIKAYHEATDPQKAQRAHKKVMDEKGKVAIPAQRLARMLYMQGPLLKDPKMFKLKDAEKQRAMQKEGEAWLKEYASQRNSPEGIAVRYELANFYNNEALLLLRAMKDPKKDVTGSNLMAKLQNQAKKLLDELAVGDHEYAQKANRLSIAIRFREMGENTPTAQLRDFDQCYLKAHYEMQLMREVAKKLGGDIKEEDKRKALEKERKEHLLEVIRALRRGLAMADSKTSAQKLDESRLLLVSAYLVAGDWFRAAVAGEALGRQQPASKNAPLGAGYALEAYANVLTRDNSEDNRQRVKNLANYVLQDQAKSWRSEPVTPIARYQLAMAYNKEENQQAAIAELEQLPSDFAGYTFAQGQIVFLALEGRDKAKKNQDDKLQALLIAKAKAALQRIPKLPDNADQYTMAMFFSAHLEQAKFLYAEGAQEMNVEKADLVKAVKKFDEMAVFLDQLQGQFAKVSPKLPPKTAENLGFSLGVIRKYALLGKVDADYRAGQFDKVLDPKTGIGALVEEVKKQGANPGKIRMKEFQVTGEILGLAMRAYVQTGKVNDAKDLLKLLERLTGEEENALEVDRAPVLQALVRELNAQVRILKKAGDSAKLKNLVGNFSIFLDELARQLSKKKDFDLRQTLFLANCYNSLGKYEKAAALYEKVPEPKCLDNKKLSEDEEKEVAEYWYAQVMYAKALRLSKDFKEAKKTLDKLQAHPNGRFALLADKEQIHLFEDQDLWGLAITKWGGLLKNPQITSNMGRNADLKTLYFEAYFRYGYCMFKYSQTDKVLKAGKETAFIRQAANHFLRLERSSNQEGWDLVKDDIIELFNNEKKLRDVYEELKKGS